MLAEYEKAPEVTRKRLYLETMQQVLSTNQKVMAGRDNNILYLPMTGGAGQAPLPPLTQLPSVKATPAPAAAETERPTRGSGSR